MNVIRLVDVDSTKPSLPLMKISYHHKSLGDDVGFYNPIYDKPDLVYGCKVFNFTPDFEYYPLDCEVIKGGSGYDLTTKLPDYIEHIYPDYDLYDMGVYDSKNRKLGEYAMGFTTRGCIRKCKFCIVPEKEGLVNKVADIYEFWKGQKFMMLLDNNLTANNEYFETTIKQLIQGKIKVDFNQGLDIRLIDDDKAKLLSKVKLWKQIHFAFDNVKTESQVRKGIETLTKHMSPSRIMFYVLIGFDSTHEEDLYRVELLRSLNIDPFVMPYNKSDPYQKNFSRWVNHKAIWKTVTWEDYRKAV